MNILPIGDDEKIDLATRAEPVVHRHESHWVGAALADLSCQYGQWRQVGLTHGRAMMHVRDLLAGWWGETFQYDAPPDDAPVERLRADGWDIRTERGARWRMIHATNFLAFHRYLRGEEPPLYAGFDGYRITTAMKVVPEQAGWPALCEEHYPDLYVRFDEFQRWLLSRGKRGEFVGLADAVVMGWDIARQRRHVARITEILAGTPHLFELANENQHPHQQVDARRFDRPAHVFSSAGSSLSGEPCPLPAWDYSTAHDARDVVKMYADACPIFLIVGYPGYAGTQGPTIANEIIGADEQEQPGRRSSNPDVFRRIAGIKREWGGGTLHLQDGIFSVPLRDRQVACAVAWQEALR